MVADGRPKEVIGEYIAVEQKKFEARSQAPVVISEVVVDPPSAPPSGRVRITGKIRTEQSMPGCLAVIRIGFGPALMAWASHGDDDLERLADEPLDINLGQGPGTWQVDAEIKSFPLFPGDYNVGIAVIEPDLTEIARSVVPFDVEGVRQDTKRLHLPLQQSNQRLE